MTKKKTPTAKLTPQDDRSICSECGETRPTTDTGRCATCDTAAANYARQHLTTEERGVRPIDLLTRLREASSLEAAIGILQPDAKRRFTAETVYELVETHNDVLPQKRGACVKVYAVAARLNKPFKVADVQSALPDVKSAAFWVRKLTSLGFLKVA